MSAIDEEMKALADFAIKSAWDRYKLELDYSEASISSLDKILEKIYWGFSSYTSAEINRGLVSETAKIWGCYLGEYMRNKWGGEWIQKESTRVVLINNIELSPINMVYQRITGNPDSNITEYINKTQVVIYRVAVNPNQAQSVTKKIGTGNSGVAVARPIIPLKLKALKLDKRLMYIPAGVGGISVIILAVVVISLISRSGGLSASGIMPSATSTNTEFLVVMDTITPSPTKTPLPTIITLPTYTPKPTKSPSPSRTPSASPSLTPTNTLTPTITDTAYIWRSPTPSRTATRTEPPLPPTFTSSPTSRPSNTPEPSPTFAPTIEPPPIIESCDVNPSAVPPLTDTKLTFTVQFSAPGYGIIVNNPPGWPGQAGCDAQDSDGDGVVSCDGSSGMLPQGETINVLIETDIGNCTVSYSTP